MINIRKLESELWESADLLRAGSKLTSNQYCMPVLGLIFLRYAYSRFKMVEAEILKNRPSRGGRVMPVEASDFAAKSALFLPKEAQYDYLVNLPSDIASAGLRNKDGHTMNSLRRRETSDANAAAAVTFWKEQCAAGYGDVLRAFDCSGLGMYWLQNVKQIYRSDMNANALMSKCETVTEPRAGYWVFRISNGKATHIGYLVDDKTVIHAKGRKYGVVKEEYKAKSWNRIGKPSCFSFDDEAIPEPKPGEKKFVWILGKSVYVRMEGNKKAKKLGISHRGELYELLGQDTKAPFWYRIDFKGRNGWISSNSKYTRLEETE